MPRDRLPYLILPVAALIAILPLILNGCSCGHDFDFHLVSWMEAARQFSHGDLHPHWAYTPAYNAGEPRFVFYPPLSWTIGAILGLIFPWTWTPILYTWLALTAAGLALYHLAKDFTTPNAALLAAAFYMVNPYMLFTAYERTAYAELLAAAWIPLLLHAVLRQQITIPRIAVPLALLWLTNAPAAVMSSYALALLTLVRLIRTVPVTNPNDVSGAPSSPRTLRLKWASREGATTKLHLALTTITGTLLGLGLAAFYLIPAAYERRYVQIAMAVIPNMRIQDNFLFHHTGDIPHDQVLHTASLIALILIALTTTALLIARSQKSRVPHPSQHHREGWDAGTSTSHLTPLAILTIAVALLLTPLTSFIWNHAPEMAFLQFPWRLLAILAAVLSLILAVALFPLKRGPVATTATVIIIAATLVWPAWSVFHQPCDDEDTVQARLALFHSTQGTDPTDEYTPITADNDSLAKTNPPYWLAQNPNAKAPANVTTGPAPNHLSITSPTPQTLILNLRDYPAWHITLNQTLISTRQQRDDGLLALPVPSGLSTLSIAYVQPTDQTIGYSVTLISLLLLLLNLFSPRSTTKTSS